KYEELAKIVKSLERRVTYLANQNGTLLGRINKIDALAEALGYKFITIDTGEMFVFGNQLKAIKKELLEDTND
ncbi:hypothetical protein LCGC14_1189450, partial [marine sediment metagenome]